MSTAPLTARLAWIAPAILAAAAACSRPAEPAPAAAPGRPRIVALVGGVVDTIDALGAMDCLVAVGSRSPYPGTEGKQKVLADERGGMTNAEAILSLRPDVVFVARELVPSLDGRGLNVVPVPQDDFEHLHEWTLEVGRIVGAEDRARELLAGMDAKAAEIRTRVAGLPKTRVYYEVGGPGRTFGPGTAAHAMIELAGGENVYRDARIARPTISMETILAADPEVIVLAIGSESREAVMSRPGWERISAVRTGRVYQLPMADRAAALYSPRCAEACERSFLRWLHPELFAGEGER